MVTKRVQTRQAYPAMTLAGIIVADQWDDSGGVISYAFQADDEKKYILMPTNIADLGIWMRKRVEVQGLLHPASQLEIFHIKERFSGNE